MLALVELEGLIEALRRPEAYPHPVGETVEVIQTHASVVFLAGEHVYKLKKPVDLGFLDYSTLAKRRAMCEAEVRLNARLAPDVYRGVTTINDDGEQVTVGGSGEVVEYAVHMERLPEEATLQAMLEEGLVEPSHIDRIAHRLVAFHRDAQRGPDVRDQGRFGVVEGNCLENFEQLEPMVKSAKGGGSSDGIVSERVFERLRRATQDALEAHRERIEARVANDVICDTHGDLRLEHVYFLPGRSEPDDLCIVDCIEFNERFRYADPIADLAFLVMDLQAHGAWRFAHDLATSYLEIARDDEGAELLPLYCAYRSTVRGKVRAMQARASEIPERERKKAFDRARGHLLLALLELAPPDGRPCLLLTAGLPGTGKSVLARALADSANLRWISSDRVRKELAGLEETASAKAAERAGIYTPEWNDETYDECLRRAEAVLLEGGRAVVDASFKQEGRRLAFVELANRLSIPLRILLCEIDEETAHRRLDARKGDASDADWQIYQHVRATWEPFGAQTAPLVHAVETSGSIEDVRKAGLDVLESLGLAGEDRKRPVL